MLSKPSYVVEVRLEVRCVLVKNKTQKAHSLIVSKQGVNMSRQRGNVANDYKRRRAKNNELAVESFFQPSYGKSKRRNISETIHVFGTAQGAKKFTFHHMNNILEEPARPAVTLSDELFLSQFERYKFSSLKLSYQNLN